MADSFVRVRRVLAGGVCLVSVLCGIVLIFRLITPRAIDHVGTPELVALLGLLVLPVATGCAFLADKRARRRAVAFALSQQAEQLREIAEPVVSRSREAWEGRSRGEAETGMTSVRAYAAVRYGLEILPHAPHRGEDRPASSGRHMERGRHHDADERVGAEGR